MMGLCDEVQARSQSLGVAVAHQAEVGHLAKLADEMDVAVLLAKEASVLSTILSGHLNVYLTFNILI